MLNPNQFLGSPPDRVYRSDKGLYTKMTKRHNQSLKAKGSNVGLPTKPPKDKQVVRDYLYLGIGK